MFSSHFPYQKLNHFNKESGEDKYIEHVFAFRGKTGKRYIVTVEQYEYFVYIVKFCLQERKIHPDKYNHLTKLGECSRVLTTIGKIVLEIYKENPFASFAFVGSNLAGESTENTKRFTLYKRVVSQFISPVIFEHRYSLNKSAYLLINRDNHEPDLLNKIIRMFDKIFEL